jgi:hypothetical protein
MSKSYSYKTLVNFGANTVNPVDDPMSYVIPSNDAVFIHGADSINKLGDSKQGQAYLSQYCSTEWDGFCEAYSRTGELNRVNQIDILRNANTLNLTTGEILIRNTAIEKYITNVADSCELKIEQYDQTVSNSPNIFYRNGVCRPQFSVDPSTIENDPVMNKILNKPEIADDILENIYKNMKKQGKLDQLKGTRLGYYYKNKYSC